MKFPLGIRGSVLMPATGLAATSEGAGGYDIMGWFEEDTNSSGNYTLKIGTNGNKIYAGPYMTYAFSYLSNVSEIRNINMLDTRYTKYMNGMFNSTGQYASTWSLNLGDSFDTSNVIM